MGFIAGFAAISSSGEFDWKSSKHLCMK
jgi:hypothetical protein